MLAHNHGQNLNQSQLGASLGVSHNTIRTWLDLLQQTFVIRQLPTWSGNTAKRLIKSPKVYICDPGLLHALLDIETLDELYGHPVYGRSWEGFVLEQLMSVASRWKPSFYRTHNGAEIDLIMEKGKKRIAVEIKASTAPVLSRGVHHSIQEIKAQQCWVIADVKEAYQIGNAEVLPLMLALERIVNE